MRARESLLKNFCLSERERERKKEVREKTHVLRIASGEIYDMRYNEWTPFFPLNSLRGLVKKG